MFDFGIQPLELVAPNTPIVYVVFILVLRVFGKREAASSPPSTSPCCCSPPMPSSPR